MLNLRPHTAPDPNVHFHPLPTPPTYLPRPHTAPDPNVHFHPYILNVGPTYLMLDPRPHTAPDPNLHFHPYQFS